MNPPCPLCLGTAAEPYYSEEQRHFFRCPACTLVWLDPAQRLSPEDERERYTYHDNAADDPAYRQFLSRLADPLVRGLRSGARGLDFGCGPAPVLAGMLSDAGFPCEAYDPFFEPRAELLERQYDFVACSEVVEHAFDPAAMFALFGRLLAPGGILGVMTRFYDHDKSFADWWYRRDPTHVCFYAESTMEWIAARRGWGLELPRPHVAVFTVPDRASRMETLPIAPS